MIYSNRLRSLLIGGVVATATVLGTVQPAQAALTSLTVSLSDPDNFPAPGRRLRSRDYLAGKSALYLEPVPGPGVALRYRADFSLLR